MRVTNATAAEKLGAYQWHEIRLDESVDWAERALMEGDLAEEHAGGLAEVLGRLGVADVRNFGLAWEDCAFVFG